MVKCSLRKAEISSFLVFIVYVLKSSVAALSNMLFVFVFLQFKMQHLDLPDCPT